MKGQLGLEDAVDDWVDGLVAVVRELARVLKPTGSLWLNVADSYSRHPRFGAPPKGQLLAPERLLLALAQDGWIVRNKVIWAKTNPMPSSVADRLNCTHEFLYFLVRSRRYYFDLDAIREPHRSAGKQGAAAGRGADDGVDWQGPLASTRGGLASLKAAGLPGHVLGKNPGDLWQLPTQGFRGAHFATFPERLIEKPIEATCPERICTQCQQPWRREVSAQRVNHSRNSPNHRDGYVNRYPQRWEVVRWIGDFVPCGCQAPTEPGLVLDPFFGSGTVGVVAERLGRDWLGIELNPVYVSLAWQRLRERKAKATAQAVASVRLMETPGDGSKVVPPDGSEDAEGSEGTEPVSPAPPEGERHGE